MENVNGNIDFCTFFADMEADPKKKIKMKVSFFLMARQHLFNCDTCFNRSERILANAPPEKLTDKPEMMN